MDFVQAIESGFKNYVNFSERASRSEYWYFCLFLLIVNIVIGIIEGFIGQNFSLISSLWNILIFLPSLSIGVRRLHDTNKTGWFVLLPLTIIGIIPYIWMLCIKGNDQENKFGPNPLSN